MNPGTFEGVDTGAVTVDSVTKYIQTPTLLSSQTVQVPSGVKRIEALLCGGGGEGLSLGGGGGFGGLAVIEIPITGQPLQVVIGAGAAGYSSDPGSPTYIVSAGTRYAEVGGGGTAGYIETNPLGRHGRSGGGGAGGGTFYGIDANMVGGNGGGPPIGKVLWTPYPQDNSTTTTQANSNAAPAGAGTGGRTVNNPGTNGSFGGGGGGGGGWTPNLSTLAGAPGGHGGGGGYGSGTTGTGGMGAGAGRDTTGNFTPSGGSLTSVSIWGYTGFANSGRAGGGMLSAGGRGGNQSGGGLGGGGAGGDGDGGGQGFAVIRFYF